MSNYIEYQDKIAFHPGYYIKEIIEDSGLTQEDFAKRLDTTPKNLSYLIRGEQSLSIDIAMKLSRLLGTTIDYWLNLQKGYDTIIAEIQSAKEFEQEKRVFKYLEYIYFKNEFSLPNAPRKTNEQIKNVREFLNISTLNVLTKPDMAVSFRSAAQNMNEASTVRANAMVQIAINQALKTTAPKFNKASFEQAIQFALTLTTNHKDFFPLIKKSFADAGVIFIILPNLPGSGINGATKKIGQNVLLMVNDRRLYSDTFWFTLFHEIGHIINGDYGISFETNNLGKEDFADKYAENQLIPLDKYQEFLKRNSFTEYSIKEFAKSIHRDPGIILGRLQKDKIIPYNHSALSNALRHRYKIYVSPEL